MSDKGGGGSMTEEELFGELDKIEAKIAALEKLLPDSCIILLTDPRLNITFDTSNPRSEEEA